MEDFEERLRSLDLSIFAKIPSQSTDEDRQSFMACQLAVRELVGRYNYLEIGSYLGGSIQPHLLDPKCTRVYSIDKRPGSQPDERGTAYIYLNNSTDRMMGELRRIEGGDIDKIVTIDGETSNIRSEEIKDKIDLCFIDGEHTDQAVFSDFRFCLNAVQGRGAIVFHDSQIVYNGIQRCLTLLESTGVNFHAYALPNAIFMIEIGDFPVHQHQAVAALLLRNHRAFLYALRENDQFRRFAKMLPFRMVRNAYLRVRGGTVSR